MSRYIHDITIMGAKPAAGKVHLGLKRKFITLSTPYPRLVEAGGPHPDAAWWAGWRGREK
jgi:hypothetical protein